MDYEKYQSRVDKGRKNTKRSDKDNVALAKAEQELYHASEVKALGGGRQATVANDLAVGVQRCR